MKKFLNNNPGYSSFQAAKAKCTNPNHWRYHLFGGRGIKFQFPSYTHLVAHIGPRPSKHHILARKNEDWHYTYGNVLWKPNPDLAKTRSDAMWRGLKTYFTGEPCKKGHIDLRGTADSWCVRCNRERNKK